MRPEPELLIYEPFSPSRENDYKSIKEELRNEIEDLEELETEKYKTVQKLKMKEFLLQQREKELANLENFTASSLNIINFYRGETIKHQEQEAQLKTEQNIALSLIKNYSDEERSIAEILDQNHYLNENKQSFKFRLSVVKNMFIFAVRCKRLLVRQKIKPLDIADVIRTHYLESTAPLREEQRIVQKYRFEQGKTLSVGIASMINECNGREKQATQENQNLEAELDTLRSRLDFTIAENARLHLQVTSANEETESSKMQKISNMNLILLEKSDEQAEQIKELTDKYDAAQKRIIEQEQLINMQENALVENQELKMKQIELRQQLYNNTTLGIIQSSIQGTTAQKLQVLRLSDSQSDDGSEDLASLRASIRKRDARFQAANLKNKYHL